MNASDNTGLGLFDDTASAVGNFPTALRGYDRTAVDDYVRTLEDSVVKSRRHATQLEQQVTMLQDEVASAGDPTDSKDVDYANLGGRANDILRLAQGKRASWCRMRRSRPRSSRSRRGARPTGCGPLRPERVTPSRPAALHKLISFAASCAMRSKPRSTRRRRSGVPDRGCPAAGRVGTPGGRQ